MIEIIISLLEKEDLEKLLELYNKIYTITLSVKRQKREE